MPLWMASILSPGSGACLCYLFSVSPWVIYRTSLISSAEWGWSRDFLLSIKFMFRISAIVLSLEGVENRRDLPGSPGDWLLPTTAGLAHQGPDPGAGGFGSLGALRDHLFNSLLLGIMTFQSPQRIVYVTLSQWHFSFSICSIASRTYLPGNSQDLAWQHLPGFYRLP